MQDGTISSPEQQLQPSEKIVLRSFVYRHTSSSGRPSFHLTTPSPDFTAVARHLCVLPGSPGRTEYSPAQLVAFVPAAYSATTTTTNHKRSSSTTQPSLAPHSIHLLHQLHLLQLLHQLLSHTTGCSCFSTTKPATLLDYLSSHSSLMLALVAASPQEHRRWSPTLMASDLHRPPPLYFC